MLYVRVPRIRMPGQSKLNQALDEWRRLIGRANALDVAAPLQIEKLETGDVVTLAAPPRRKVRLTGAGATPGSYDAVEAYETAGGGWADTPSGWSGTAWEYNLNAAVAVPSHAEVEYHAPSGDWRFQKDTCP